MYRNLYRVKIVPSSQTRRFLKIIGHEGSSILIQMPMIRKSGKKSIRRKILRKISKIRFRRRSHGVIVIAEKFTTAIPFHSMISRGIFENSHGIIVWIVRIP